MDSSEYETLTPIPGVLDANRARQAVTEVLKDLHDIAPALSNEDKARIAQICQLKNAHEIISANEISSQFELVKLLRSKVIDDANILQTNSAREISALVTAINSFVNLYIRNEEKIDHLREITDMREAVFHAIAELGPEVTQKFFDKLEPGND